MEIASDRHGFSMGVLIQHQAAAPGRAWNVHSWQAAWDGNNVWDRPGKFAGSTVDFQLPDSDDARSLQFKFNSTQSGSTVWDSDDFIRRLSQIAPVAVWTFEASPRVIYQDPNPPGVAFLAGSVLIFQVLTQSAFRGGQIYAWDPYNSANQPITFGESVRNDATGISTFRVTLQPWMTTGFNLKLTRPASGGQDALWEADSANRVWRPCDGAVLWLKSGQCDVRNVPLALTPVTLEVLYGATSPVPQYVLTDLAERSTFLCASTSSAPYGGSALFRVATFSIPIYPGAAYSLADGANLENPPISRPFPADPTILGTPSRFVLGAGGWLSALPTISPVPLQAQANGNSSFAGGLSIQVSLGNGPVYQTVPAIPHAGIYQATIDVALNTTTAIDLVPTGATEPKPYAWLDTSRYFTPSGKTLYTTEGVYGVCEKSPTRFTEPASRTNLMQAAFGNATVAANVFAGREMPHGATLLGGDVYFVVHAPHAVCATLILVNETAPGAPARTEVPMQLTGDTFYWWCSVPLGQASPGTRYRFLLNDNVEVLDPAARDIQDGGDLGSNFGDLPTAATSWSKVLDVAAVSASAHAQPWQTMGWQDLLIYELHARRFTNSAPAPGAGMPFDYLVDELNLVSRLGQAGYLRALPATAFGLMPINEFCGEFSWGYDPSFYFAVDGFYGGAAGLASFVNAAHQNGRAVTVDVVYNHSLGSSLMQIAPDVYRNGDYDGDRMNCGHPMVGEYFRQAIVYMFRTFNLDGFRFDDTQTIVTKCVGGWEFLGMIRSAIRNAATADGRPWPYLVAENSATNPWDVSNPSSGVLDGQWGIDESYRIRDVSYDSWNAGSDNSGRLMGEMNQPQYWGRPYFQATRFGESHDMVSEQDAGNKRIAARPPFGQGYWLAKALGTLTLFSNGVPMFFMGQEVGETQGFSFPDNTQFLNPQVHDAGPVTDQTRILAWFRQIIGLRNDSAKGLQDGTNYQVVATGYRTVAFTCGQGQSIFAVMTFGTSNQQQNSGWLGLPAGAPYKEIFNSSWPVFQCAFEQENSNGGYNAQIYSGQILNLPFMGAVVLERCY